MSAGNHTPGPWKYSLHGDGAEVTGPRGYVAQTYFCMTPHQTEANARLIAAAPDLLRELELAERIILNALALMTTDQKREWAHRNDQVGASGEGTTRYHERKAVIAKATGAAA